MAALWQGFDPRVIMIFTVYLAITEIFIQFRWRVTIVCKECGFDPVLYLKDTDAAAQKVKIRLEQRKNDPESLLKPPLQIPKVYKKAEKVSNAVKPKPPTGALVSRKI